MHDCLVRGQYAVPERCAIMIARSQAHVISIAERGEARHCASKLLNRGRASWASPRAICFG